MEMTNEEDLRSRRVVKISAIAETLGMPLLELRALMAETSTPVVDLGKGRECMFIEHLDDILMSRCRTPVVA